MSSRVYAERHAEIEVHGQNTSSFSEEFISGTGNFMTHMAALVERSKAFGSGLGSGDVLPPGICPGFYSEKYNAEERLGSEGAFGEIWKASRKGGTIRDKILKSMMYMKGYRDLDNFDPIELLPLRLNLPFVSRLENVFHDRTARKVWIAQPRYAGDLGRFKASSASEVLAIAKQYAYGLWQIHRLGLLYGDVKPENTFWVDNEQTQIVLADFGMALPCLHAGTVCTNRYAGTPEFLAPSIISENKYGFEVDWWAFGVMLMELVGGSCYSRYAQTISGGLTVNQKATYDAIIRGNCQFSSKAQIKKNEYAGLLKFVLKISTPQSFTKLFENDNARALMQSANPANHPVLSDPYFFGESAQETGWYNVCHTYYRQDECSPTRTPSLGPLCKDGDSTMQQAVSQNDPQEALIASLASARDTQSQAHMNWDATIVEAFEICGDVCSVSHWLSHYKDKWPKASKKMANACEFITNKGSTLQASDCKSLGVSNNSPRRKCCQCITSTQCQENPNCVKAACPMHT
eukprot:CAMPEP_0172935476 /NCGR_PEP_ID=MMETSP1075-20121228/221531_1 /TAXON_ID=2916 /ORGANISM="Ceratium fusus, Strain PA161109" /LENGTH=518 /DNA_ID=CAMNT_0013796835 /DNA_START=112 /DNA_END=1668 /DNA_ORIENTATION=-